MGGISIWGGIIEAGGEIKRRGLGWFTSFKRGLGDGSSICFWKDIWVGNSSLKERFPRLYFLEPCKGATVREKGLLREDGWGWVWQWCRLPRGRAVKDLEDLQSLIHNISPSLNCRDFWTWNLNDEGIFSTAILRAKLDEIVWGSLSVGGTAATQWNSLIPRKICIFVWRAKQGKLPVRVALDNRGIDLNSILCPWCDNEKETFDHCLVNCPLLQPAWGDIFKWWGCCFSNISSVNELVSHQGQVFFNQNSRKAWRAVLWAACYLIWANRNEKIFRQKGLPHQNLVALLKTRCFDWVSRRCRKGSLVWEEWLKDPAEATKLIS